MSGAVPPRTVMVRAHQLAWMRRPELEAGHAPGIQVWEKPDGELVLTKGEPILQLVRHG